MSTSPTPLDPTSLPPRVENDADDAALTAVREVIDRGPFTDSWESLRGYEPPLWYHDARFGIFIHWGLYSVPAFGSEWYARNMYLEGTPEFEHHVATYGPHDRFGYKDFIPEFRMERFDPDEWATIFRASGAQFVVPVAEHHDGFPLYDSARSRWTAARLGPERDVFGDLMGALDRAWLARGASSHRAEHWFFMNGGSRFDSDVRDPRFSDFYGPAQRQEVAPHERYLQDWLLRTVEIIDRYRPQVLWFDWWIEEPAFEPYLRTMAAYYYNRAAEWGLGVAINFKWEAFPEGTAVYDIERGAMGGIRPMVWQNDTSVSRSSWGWVDGHRYKTVPDLVAELVDTVSKNGNLLLNVGPKPDGTIPPEEVALLRGIGDWLGVNGQAVFGTRPWTIPAEGPTAQAVGSFVDGDSPVYTAEDIRFTTRTDKSGDYVYATLLAAPDDGVVRIRSFGSGSGLLDREIQEVRVLGTDGPVGWDRTADALEVRLGAPSTGALGPVLKLFLAARTTPPRTDSLHG